MTGEPRPHGSDRAKDLVAVGVLVLVPTACFALASGLGHPIVAGDNLIQNLPLRVLVGRDVSALHLPLWDPYLWGGTPLLAGFNAGAFFPGTLVFAVLPALVAFTLNEIAIVAIAGVGTYVLARAQAGCSPGPAFVGGLAFAFGGFMSAQLVHLDLVEAAALLPIMLLALLRLADLPEQDPAWRYSVLLGSTFALAILSGSAEGMADEAVALGVVFLFLFVTRPATRLRLARGSAVAAALALGLGAVQWVPGLEFAGSSQRAHASYAYFATGSLPPSTAVLVLLPYLLGGFGVVGPTYLGPYNLAEVSSFVGVLPLAAALALAVGPRTRRRGTGVWYLLAATGTLLALGRATPLGHLAHLVPFYGQQRLQNRNVLDVDLALALLAAIWLERLRAPRVRLGKPERLAAALPGVAAVALTTVFFFDPTGVLVFFGGSPRRAAVGGIEGYLEIAAPAALVVAALAAAADRLPSRVRFGLLAATVAFDLAFFGVNGQWLVSAPARVVTDETPAAAALSAATGSGRFAVYDPDLVDYPSLLALGEPDLGIWRRTASVQGFSSLVSQSYEAATGAHRQASLSPSALRGTVFNELDLTVLAALPAAFLVRLAPDGTRGVPKATAPPPPGAVAEGRVSLDGIPVAKTATPGPTERRLVPGASTGWYLGAPLRVREVTVSLARRSPSARLRVGLLLASGGVAFQRPVFATSAALSVRVGGPDRAVGVEVSDTGNRPVTVKTVSVTTTAGPFLLEGPLAQVVTPPRFSYAGTDGGFALFRNHAAMGRFFVQPLRPLPSGAHPPRVHEVASPATGGATVEVSSPVPVRLVRSATYASGWRALVARTQQGALGQGLRRPSPPARVVEPVEPDGLLQSVVLPAGTTLVTFSYRPESVAIGLATSAAATGALVAWAAGASVRRLRARAGRARPRSSGLPSSKPLRPIPPRPPLLEPHARKERP